MHGKKFPSFWATVTRSPEWEAWEKEVSRRMMKHYEGEKITGVYDVAECRDCGWISPEHLAEFFKFIKNNLKK